VTTPRKVLRQLTEKSSFKRQSKVETHLLVSTYFPFSDLFIKSNKREFVSVDYISHFGKNRFTFLYFVCCGCCL
jgi:hypothetical protein